MVEFALILPLLLLVVFGIIELGRLLVIYSSVGTASREAARYASASGESASGVPYYMDCAGTRAAAQRMGILVGMENGDIKVIIDDGQNPTPGEIAGCDDVNDLRLITGVDVNGDPIFGDLVDEHDIDLGDRVSVEASAEYQPFMPLVNLDSFPLSSRSARTIIKDVYIEAP
jgi:hypothetical protein